MKLPRQLAALISLAVLLGTNGRQAHADRLTMHYGPAVIGPGAAFKPGEFPPAGEIVRWRRVCKAACSHPPLPNQWVCFKHACTGQSVQVPLFLPWGTPRIEHVWGKIVYNYGSYTVTVRFLPGGSVDVTYFSGPLRPL
jgi:hypothetical protein